MQSYKDFLLELDKYRNKIIYARITSLSFSERPKESIEGRVTQGSINLDGASALRRSCSLTMVANSFDYSDYLWGLNTKFKLEIGVENNINPNFPKIIWFNQGIYLISSFNTSRSASNFTITIQGKDKMCLLNGEVGGSLGASTDFGQIEEEDQNGNWVIKKIPIPEIIRNAVHVYANEPYHNIIINDLDTYGLELLEYRYDTPMYLWRDANSTIYTNAILENDDARYYLQQGGQPVKLADIPVTHLDLLVETLVGTDNPQPVYIYERGAYVPYYFAKVSYGQTAGYRETDLTYAGDLIGNVGESIVSILDKIKNMLVEFEYFYDVNGQFIFQKKQSFISTMWSPSGIVERTEIEIMENALDKLKPNMTEEQYQDYQHSSNIAWGAYDRKLSETIIAYSTFRQKSYEEQVQYLQNLLIEYETAYYASNLTTQMPEYLNQAENHAYVFNSGELITAFNNNPNLMNLRNDYSIWGERTGVSGAKIPVHMRYAIDIKPSYYKTFNGKFYLTDKNVIEELKRKEKEKIQNQFYDKILGFNLKYDIPEELPRPVRQGDGSWSAGWWDIRDWHDYYMTLTDTVPSYTMKWYSRNDAEGCVPALSLPVTYTSRVNEDNYVWLLIRNKDGRYNPQHGSGNPINSASMCTLYSSIYNDDGTYTTSPVLDENGQRIRKEFIPPYSGCSDNHTYVEFLEGDVKRSGNTVYFYNPSFPAYDSYEDLVSDQIDKEFEEYEKQGLLNYVDWREIIYQMATDYYKHNTEDTYESQLAINNAPYYDSGRTGYEQYYIDIQGFWRELYYPTLGSEWQEKANELDQLEAELEVLTKEVYGEEVDYSDNNLGGIENDLAALTNLMDGTSEKYTKATSLVSYWNTGRTNANITNDMISSFTAPKYDFKAPNASGTLVQVSDPDTYLAMLSDWYFRRKSNLETLQIKVSDLSAKVDKLEKNATENYYLGDNEIESRKYWNKMVYEAPENLNFWFDFLDAHNESEMAKYNVQNIGSRTKSINDTNVKSIYFRETPGVVFGAADENKGGTGYKYIQVPNIDTMFSISAQGKSAKERLDELLYRHSYCVESATVTTIPIYYLQPNTRIYLYDEDTKLNGDYIVSKITIPLAYNGTMQLTVTKAAENIL